MTDTAPDLDELLAPSALPASHDPLAAGILMAHQRAWLEDQSAMKLAAKGRRTGITYAEALDDTLIAAAARSAGGDNVFYIGDTKEKGLEFIRYVAHFARIVAKELTGVEEFLFEDRREDGNSKHIAAYRVKFASGFQVVALSSSPGSIRGLQGVVVIDEAAFHRDVALVLDAVNALLIWGGRIRVISTHNGEDNAFNALIQDTEKGLYDYSIHSIPFSAAVANGLYERVCLMRGWAATPEGKADWLGKITRAYGPRSEARAEELEAIPRRSSGAYLPRSLVQRATEPGIPVIRWAQGEGWYLDDTRLVVARVWFRQHVEPLLRALDPSRRHTLGQDFGRTGDLSSIAVLEEAEPGTWRTALVVELRRIPFDVQQQLLFDILELLTRWRAALDARGNGQSHAEAAQQKFGIARVDCIMATVGWYAQAFPDYRAALEDRSILLPDDADIIADHRAAVLVRGLPTMGDAHSKGADGEERHGDSLVALLLAHAATATEPVQMAFASTGKPRPSMQSRADFLAGMA